MIFLRNATLIAMVLAISSPVLAQHSDVEFGYEGGQIFFETEGPPGIDAVTVFESEFEIFNMDGTQVAEDPGFATNFTEGDEVFMVTPGDSLFVNVNQSTTLGSFLTFFNPATMSFETTTATFTIEDNSPGGTSDLIVSAGGLAGDFSQFIATSEGFEIDAHVDFILSSGAEAGAYGLLLNIESDNLSGDLTDTTSELFWVVFNNGLSEQAFASAVSQFTVAIPEPSAALLIAASSLALLRRRRH